MPTQNTDIFNAATPGIQYAGPGITWKIANGVSVGSGTNLGVYSNFINSKLVNKGTVHSNNNIGAYFQQSNTEILNTKSGLITGPTYALYLGGATPVQNAEVHNKGDILSPNGYGFVAQEVSNLWLYNTGEIYGQNYGVVIITNNAAPKPSKVDNDGKIHSGVYGLVSIVHSSLTTKIVNREDGVIKGDLFSIVATGGMLKVKNEGKVKGDILSTAANANDTVINKSKIKGDTYLGPGNDVFKNKDGKAKMLFGEEGNDKFIAGKTKDQIVFDTTLNELTNVDRVKKFEPGKDQFYLDQTIFASLTGPGPLLASEFRKGNAAVDADDFIVYHKGSGSLFYDPDGSGAMSQTKFAQVDKGTKLSHNDFTVIA